MKYLLKKLNKISLIIDILMIPLTITGSIWFRIVRYLELKHYPFTKKILFKVGVFPLVDHYYETQFNFEKDIEKLNTERLLKGIDLNIDYQLNLLKSFDYADELKKIGKHKVDEGYYYSNGSFNTGDADYYYSLIRKNKPQKIIEVGSGFSTLLALRAIQQNSIENSLATTDLICIEPYEMPWLSKQPIRLIRKKVEDLDLSIFRELNENDILFIDSSHIIKPEGDVTFQFLKILPELKKGVYIHFHDIFTPYQYPIEWLVNDFRFWNEQYLLEAFLSFNNAFEVTGSLAYLQRNYHDLLAEKFPVLKGDRKRLPGSFWIRKIC